MEMSTKICINMYMDTISMVSTLCVSMCVLINKRLCRSRIFFLHSKLKNPQTRVFLNSVMKSIKIFWTESHWGLGNMFSQDQSLKLGYKPKPLNRNAPVPLWQWRDIFAVTAEVLRHTHIFKNCFSLIFQRGFFSSVEQQNLLQLWQWRKDKHVEIHKCQVWQT